MTCGTDEHGQIKRLTPVKAIRAKCLDCCAGSSKEVEKCTVEKCSLYPYRFGKSPARKGLGTKGVIPPGLAKYHTLTRAKISKGED